MRNLLLLVCFLGLISTVQATDIAIPFQYRFDDALKLDALIERSTQPDLARIKLTIDKLVDPSIDIDGTLKTIDRMVRQINTMLKANDSSMVKMLTLKKYLYHKGYWNQYKPYQYDFNDPMGTKIENKLLTTYLDTKQGNCVTMPILFIILGDRLGLDVTLSTAPLHYFVKFKDDETGRTHNLETTSGANITRDDWYREQMPMTDKAIANGVYLQALTQKELIATMVVMLGEHLMAIKEYNKAIDAFQVVLKHYPKNIYAIVKTASSFTRLLKKHFLNQWHPDEIPPERRPQFDFYVKHQRDFWANADGLGFKAQPKAFDEQYLQKVYRNAK